jgi:hypothetical protein
MKGSLMPCTIFAPLFFEPRSNSQLRERPCVRFLKARHLRDLKIGVYVRDAYDFNVGLFDDTLVELGIWEKRWMLSKQEMAVCRMNQLTALANVFPGFVPVRNGGFRRWQTRGTKVVISLFSPTSCG